jgi:hypothetical protein
MYNVCSIQILNFQENNLFICIKKCLTCISPIFKFTWSYGQKTIIKSSADIIKLKNSTK